MQGDIYDGRQIGTEIVKQIGRLGGTQADIQAGS
jgi:hypothetical protein